MKLKYFIVVIIVLILSIFLAFYWGKQQANVQITNIATNEFLIKDIAELAALEVQGTAQINETNITNDGGVIASIKKMFIENSVHIAIPYIAKYGVMADSNNIEFVIQKDKQLIIVLPEPKLLSLEMRLDKVIQSSSQGWFKSENYEQFSQVQQKLYMQTRSQMANSEKNKALAKDKIVHILKNYYQPLGYNVSVKFGNDSNYIPLFPTSIESNKTISN